MKQKTALNFGTLGRAIYAQVQRRPLWVLPEHTQGSIPYAERASQTHVVELLYSMLWDDRNTYNTPEVGRSTACDLLNHKRSIHRKVREAARDVDIALIRQNVRTRLFAYLEEDNIRAFLHDLRGLIDGLPQGQDLLKLKKLSAQLSAVDPAREDSMETAYAVTAACIYFCLNAPNTDAERAAGSHLPPVPKDVRGHYDPYSYSDRQRQSRAVTIELVAEGEDAPTEKFHILEYAREYILRHSLILTQLFCTGQVITLRYVSGEAMGYRLARVEGPAACQQVQQLIGQHLLEFKPKLTWAPRTLDEMAIHGLMGEEDEPPKWVGYAYYDRQGALAAFLDYKLRCDGDVELGIQLTDSPHRHRHLATSLIYFVRLSFAAYRLYAGTYEENQFMRRALEHCGFLPNYFYDHTLHIQTNKIQERVNPNDTLSSSVYYQAFSLLSQMESQRA